MTEIKRRGLMLVLSSPSGAGKTTVSHMLLKVDKHIHSSVSYTTRSMREGEVNGVHYHFIEKERFMKMVEQGEFLEYAEAFGNMYGTPKSLVNDFLDNGEDVLFDIEWQGHRKLKELAPEDVVSVFILPPSKRELLKRLERRAKDAKETIELRFQKANSELNHWEEYDYTIVNRDLDESLKKILAILRAERLRKNRRLGVFDFVDKLKKEVIS